MTALKSLAINGLTVVPTRRHENPADAGRCRLDGKRTLTNSFIVDHGRPGVIARIADNLKVAGKNHNAPVVPGDADRGRGLPAGRVGYPKPDQVGGISVAGTYGECHTGRGGLLPFLDRDPVQRQKKYQNHQTGD